MAGIGSDEINNQLMATRQREHELQQKNTDLQLKLLEAESKLQAMNRQTETDNKEVRLYLHCFVVSLLQQVLKHVILFPVKHLLSY